MNLHSLDENVALISTSIDCTIEDKNENLSSVTIESISESEDENTKEIKSNIEKSNTIPKEQFDDLEKFGELPLEESSRVVPKENCDDLENRSPKNVSSNSNDLNAEELEDDIEESDHISLPSSYHKTTTTRVLITDDDDEIIGYTSSISSETIVGKDN